LVLVFSCFSTDSFGVLEIENGALSERSEEVSQLGSSYRSRY
jgi:hypothetical protein